MKNHNVAIDYSSLNHFLQVLLLILLAIAYKFKIVINHFPNHFFQTEFAVYSVVAWKKAIATSRFSQLTTG